MEAKEPIVKLIKALIEINMPAQRQLLIDFMMGRRSRQIEEYELFDKEYFGVGETNDEDFWATIIDTAYENGLIKQMVTKKNALMPTAAGKKFAKKPKSFTIPDDESITETETDVPEIDSILEQAQKERPQWPVWSVQGRHDHREDHEELPDEALLVRCDVGDAGSV